MTGIEHRAETIRALRQLCGKVVNSDQPEIQARVSLGIPALDALLPGGGLQRGSLVEWLAPVAGSGVAILALQAVRPAIKRRPVWAVIDPACEFYPPAACGWGIPLESLLLLRPSSREDAIWAVEQCLRCPAVGITWFQAETISDRTAHDRNIPDRNIPDRVVQRWKRAAEIGGGVGMLFRPDDAIRHASWADVRWRVHRRTASQKVSDTLKKRVSDTFWDAGSAGGIVRVELVSCRGCFAGGGVDLELHDATGHVCVVSAMASPATVVRAAGA